LDIIPVIDLKDTVVVHARKGDRSHYRPIGSCLSRSSQPLEVVAGLLTVHPFRTLYVADLDAIMGTGGNRAVLEAIAQTYPTLELWVDRGFPDAASVRDFLAMTNAHAVVGSESLKNPDPMKSLREEPRVLLSIDRLDSRYLGPPELVEDASLWPERIIAMTLDRVGGTEGPDPYVLAELQERGHGRRVYAAGGVRSATDLEALERWGAAGALVGSALHNGRLGADDIARFLNDSPNEKGARPAPDA
jgi:phosphoribosylformimino-5-aminoimidazole carboxamide ribotide isomerase